MEENLIKVLTQYPFLAYFDIFKNFYANKQLDNAFIIHSSEENSRGYIDAYSYIATDITINSLRSGSEAVSNFTFNFLSTLEFDSKLKGQYLRLHGTNLYDKYMKLICKVKKGSTQTAYEGDLLELLS